MIAHSLGLNVAGERWLGLEGAVGIARRMSLPALTRKKWVWSGIR